MEGDEWARETLERTEGFKGASSPPTQFQVLIWKEGVQGEGEA